jgi:predicted DNA-binding protein
MPKGEPNKNTVRVDRYQKKAGYKTKAFKLKGDIAERFADACDKAGVSQAAKITELMEQFISEVNKI